VYIRTGGDFTKKYAGSDDQFFMMNGVKPLAGGVYSVIIPADKIEDLAGNDFAGIGMDRYTLAVKQRSGDVTKIIMIKEE
jgi:hypothetical protein